MEIPRAIVFLISCIWQTWRPTRQGLRDFGADWEREGMHAHTGGERKHSL